MISRIWVKQEKFDVIPENISLIYCSIMCILGDKPNYALIFQTPQIVAKMMTVITMLPVEMVTDRTRVNVMQVSLGMKHIACLFKKRVS